MNAEVQYIFILEKPRTFVFQSFVNLIIFPFYDALHDFRISECLETPPEMIDIHIFDSPIFEYL